MRGLIHHVDLSLRNVAEAEPLYDLVLTHFGYAKGKRYPGGGGEWDRPDGASIGISPTRGENADRLHDRYSSGLHHLAFRAGSREDVDVITQSSQPSARPSSIRRPTIRSTIMAGAITRSFSPTRTASSSKRYGRRKPTSCRSSHLSAQAAFGLNRRTLIVFSISAA